MPNCANCSAPLDPEFKFCPQCSQKIKLHRICLGEVGHEALHYFTHADKGVLGLLRDLWTKNGIVAKEYVEGRRKKYFPPLNFFLLVATLFVLVMTATVPHKTFDVRQEYPGIAHIPDPVKREEAYGEAERGHKVGVFMSKYGNVVSMVAVPLICFVFWLFYLRGRYNYAEHLVACMYMAGFTNLLYAFVFVPIGMLVNASHDRSTELVLLSVFMAFQAIYYARFYYRFIGKGTTASAVKATLVSAFVTAFWFTLSGALIAAYIANGFGGWLH